MAWKKADDQGNEWLNPAL